MADCKGLQDRAVQVQGWLFDQFCFHRAYSAGALNVNNTKFNVNPGSSQAVMHDIMWAGRTVIYESDW